MSAEDDYSESEEASEMGLTPASMPIEIGKMPVLEEKKKKSFVELHYLEAAETKTTEGSTSIQAAATKSLGNMILRGGSRNLPVAVFGGPVVCVATKSEENDEGSAHFYARKSDDRGTKAAEYVATGPTLPFPDLVVWDDDGVYCAVIAHNRVAVYLSEPPSLVLMGSVRVALPSHADSRITSARFIHGVLYCCTVSSVHAGKLHCPSQSCSYFGFVRLTPQLHQSSLATGRLYFGSIRIHWHPMKFQPWTRNTLAAQQKL